jgi:hypothetical protein
MYADDLKIAKVINSAVDIVRLQEDNDGLVRCCVANKMKLKQSKCYRVTFSRKAMT